MSRKQKQGWILNAFLAILLVVTVVAGLTKGDGAKAGVVTVDFDDPPGGQASVTVIPHTAPADEGLDIWWEVEWERNYIPDEPIYHGLHLYSASPEIDFDFFRPLESSEGLTGSFTLPEDEPIHLICPPPLPESILYEFKYGEWELPDPNGDAAREERKIEKELEQMLLDGMGACPTPTPSPSTSPSPTYTPTPTPSPSPTVSTSPTPSPSPSPTPTQSPSPTPA